MGDPRNADATGPGERVRFCLRCGALVAFDVRRCPACGHEEAPAGPDAAARVACDGCGAPRPALLQICPACGREAEGRWPAAPRVPPWQPPRATSLVPALVLVAWLGPVAAALGLALALR
jgi:RNA polymerase subunit RPABC4/transcription elongation factor Spt4